jgi:hypothetical protein
MLSVTTYLTTDVAPIPLLWVIPLALYLLTFILAFARRPLIPLRLVNRTLPLVVLVVVVLLLSEATTTRAGPVWILLVFHLLALFWIALYCHGTLARMRPDPSHLTEFYFWLSLGGVLGGVLNGLLAPLLFDRITEYPLALVLACLLRGVGREPAAQVSGKGSGGRVAAGGLARLMVRWPIATVQDVLLPLAVGVLTLVLVLVGRSMDLPAGPVGIAVMFSIPLVICYTFLERPLRFALGIGALLLASTLSPGVHGKVEYRERNFFGVHQVVLITDEYNNTYRRLIHGNTIHGEQSTKPGHRRDPLGYYHLHGPVGRLFTFLQETKRVPRQVGVVGLGCGALTAYAQEGQHWTYYEIDPAVIYIARDSGYFTLLGDCPATWDIREGDARIMLGRTADTYDLLIIDAFSSDALPIHLFTREALRVYLDRLNEGGLLFFHVSNRYLNMEPVLGALAADAGLACLVRSDQDDLAKGKFASIWVVMGRPGTPLGELAHQSAAWWPLTGGPGQPLWTDEHSDLFSILK